MKVILNCYEGHTQIGDSKLFRFYKKQFTLNHIFLRSICNTCLCTGFEYVNEEEYFSLEKNIND